MVDRFNVNGKTAVVTGDGGILCSEMAIALAGRGVKVAILDINETQEAIQWSIRCQQFRKWRSGSC